MMFWDAKKKSELDFLWHRSLKRHESQCFGTAVNLGIEGGIGLREVAQRKWKEK